MPTLRRASLPFALLLPVLLGLSGGTRVAGRVRSMRLARLDFASALDAARSGHRSVHSTTLPPLHGV